MALDLETTGLNRERDRIIQYGIFGTHGCSISALVDAETPTGRDPRNIPNVSAAEVKRARPLRESHLDILFAALHQRVVIMHNGAHDWAFIEQEFKRHARTAPEPRLRICTYSWARRARLSGSLILGDLCARFGVPLAVAHHAWHDACATFYLYTVWLNSPHMLPARPIDVDAVVQGCSLYFLPPDAPTWLQIRLKNTKTDLLAPSTSASARSSYEPAAFHVEIADLRRHIARYRYAPAPCHSSN